MQKEQYEFCSHFLPLAMVRETFIGNPWYRKSDAFSYNSRRNVIEKENIFVQRSVDMLVPNTHGNRFKHKT